MSGRGKHIDIDVFGNGDVPSKSGHVWPEEEDYTGKLGRPRHNTASLLRFAESAAKSRAGAAKRAAKAANRASKLPTTGHGVSSGSGGGGGAAEPWTLPDTHPAAGLSYGLGRVRRVTVKARYRLNNSRGGGPNRGQPLHKHIVYLARPEAQQHDSADEQHEDLTRSEAVFFDAWDDGIDAAHLPQAWRSDRHHWRIIVSPEEAADLDLKAYARAFVFRLEHHLRSPLEWVSVVHVNTDHPHVHLLIRGRRADGRDLTMTPSTVSDKLRELAELELVSRLGLHDEARADVNLTQMARQNRPTPLDNLLNRLAHVDRDDAGVGPFRLPASWVPEACGVHHLRSRLETLERLGLATHEVRQGTGLVGVVWWTLRVDWQEQLARNAASVTSRAPVLAASSPAKRLPTTKTMARRTSARSGSVERGGAEL